MRIIRVLLFAIATGQVCWAYRILTATAFKGKSHYIVLEALVKGLARKGHQIDMISPFPPPPVKTPNVTQIITIKREKGFHDRFDLDKFNYDWSWMYYIGMENCRHLGDEEILNLTRNPPKDPPYDAFITMTGITNCFMILADLLDVPIIYLQTTSLYPWDHDNVGNPENIAISENNAAPVPFEHASFLWRLYNFWAFHDVKLNFWWRTKSHDEFLKRHWPRAGRTVVGIARNISLMLVNTYFPVNGVKPTGMNVVEIGGVHVPQIDGPTLTPELKRWLDESESGVILFSLGSLMKTEDLSDEMIKVFFGALEKMSPVRVITKIAEPDKLRVKLPANFHSMPWLPQQKILEHPNVKLFLTQSGTVGTQESIYYGVPMLCIPLILDQWNNARNLVRKKVALQLDIKSLTEQKLLNALNELWQNPIYRKNVKELSRLFRDRPQSAIDTANYWIEYVIRNGWDSLRSPAMALTWWQVALLDVIAVSLVGLLVTFYLLELIFVKILKFFKRRVIKCRDNLKKKKQS